MIHKKLLIKKLAQNALDEMWGNVSCPKDYIEGGCSFCKLAKENCSICLLPKYFCEKEDDKLKTNTLISNIRYARDYLIRESRKLSRAGGYRFLMHQRFYHYLELIKQGLKDMSIYGKVRKKTEKQIKQILHL